MDRKGGTVFLLLVCCVVLASTLKVKSISNIISCATKLVEECKDKSYSVTGNRMPDFSKIFSEMGRDLVAEEKDTGSRPATVSSIFAEALKSVFRDSTLSKKLESLQKTGSGDNTDLPSLIQKSRNIPDNLKCYYEGTLASMSLDALGSMEINNMTAEGFEVVVQSTEKTGEKCQKIPELSPNISEEKMWIMMKLFVKKYHSLKTKARMIVQRVEDRVKQTLKCDKGDTSDSDKCKGWVTKSVLIKLGPYISHLTKEDIMYSPKQDFCEFFKSEQFEGAMDKLCRFHPIVSKALYNKAKNCTDGPMNLGRLGPLACHSPGLADKLKEDPSKICPLLPCCSEDQKELVIQTIKTESTRPCGTYLFSETELGKLTGKVLMDAMNNLKTMKSNLSKRQLRSLVNSCEKDRECVEKYLKDPKLAQLLSNELPLSVLENVAKTFKPGQLKNISKYIERRQAFVIAKQFKNTINSTKLMEIPDEIAQVLPLENLKRAKFSSWYNVTKKKWRMGQTCLLANMMISDVEHWYREPGSLISCIPCKNIEEVEGASIQEMIEGLTRYPERLSIIQATCIAKKLFDYLKAKKPDYFKTILNSKFDAIPTVLLLQLPAKQVNDLPDSVCPALLNKMKTADLTILPKYFPSRVAFMKRTLRCMLEVKGKDLSTVSSEDMNMLGQLLCEVPPSQLRLLRGSVRRTSLQKMASCDFIPRAHIEGVIQLVIDTFGNPKTWSETTLDEMLLLLVRDENALRLLPKEQWVLDIILYNRHLLPRDMKYLFEFILSVYKAKAEASPTEVQSPASRIERAANPNSNGNGNGNGNNKPEGGSTNSTSSNSTSADETDVSDMEPTTQLIKDLGNQNYKWTPEQLENITATMFRETVDVLGNVTAYNPQQLEVLSRKAFELFGKTQDMSATEVTRLGCIAQGFTPEKLMAMEFRLNSLSDIASCRWTHAQVSAVWKAVAKQDSLSAGSLTSSDMAALGRFMCGLNSTEIQQLDRTAFQNALASLSAMVCSTEKAEMYKNLTLEAFGSPSSWNETHVAELGPLIASLSAQELASLDAALFSFFTKDTIPLISSQQMAALSVAQIESLGAENADLVTNEQKKDMNQDQLAALARALTGSREQNVEGGGNGAPSVVAGGMGTFVNLLVLLLLSVIL